MATTRTLMTVEELLGLPDGDGRRELVRGELREMSPTNYRHARVVTRMARLLDEFVEEAGVGEVLTGDPGFVLERGPDTVRCPDLAFIRTDRTLPLEQQRGFAELAPDLAIEVLSPNNRPGEMREKIGQFFAAGVRAIWVVDPEHEVVRVHLPDGQIRELAGDEVVDGGDILPGFGHPARAFFPQ